MSTLFQVREVSKAYGTRVLLMDASVSVVEKQKIGFIGRNGAGKSTLVRMIAEQEKADTGEIVRMPILRLGYLEQQEVFLENESVLTYLERKSNKADWECSKMAGVFHLKGDILLRAVTSLSGGYQMRVRLVAMLLQDPNFLLLDEPTNYLDLQTVLLLEQFLRNFRGGFLVVSHDREFLMNTCTETLEVERGKLNLYPGNVEEYLAWKDEQEALTRRYNKNVEAQQKHLQTFIDRFRFKASKATQAQSKIKMLRRLKTIDIAHVLKTARIRIPPILVKKGIAFQAKDLSIGYAEKVIAHADEFDIDRGEHVAVLGENGQGKSTLLKTMAGELSPVNGLAKWGHKIKVGYYAQHVHLALRAEETVGDYLERMSGPGVSTEDSLRMAGNFLFSLDDFTKPISVLSGGERARLCFAALLLEKNDALLLDEPTNHLDFETVEALAEALAEFQGTIFFVSHSRTFTNRLATSIIDIRDSLIRRIPETYELYVNEIADSLGLDSSSDVRAHAMRPAASPSDSLSDQPPTRTKTEIYEDINERKKELRKLEKQVVEFRSERDALMQFFLDHPTDFSKEKTQRIRIVEDIISSLEERWLILHDDIEKLGREKELITL